MPTARRAALLRLARALRVAGDEGRSRRDRTRAARYAACLAERLGELRRPARCEWCRGRERLERHHWDYAAPLAVTYLCRDCHGLADAMARSA